MYRSNEDAFRSRYREVSQQLEQLRDTQRDMAKVVDRIADLEDEERNLRRMAARRLPRLDQLKIAKPCPARWEDMRGDEKTRFCSRCAKDVYNVAAMAHHEAESLLRNASGGVCLRVFRRRDGTVITSDCPVGVTRHRRNLVAAVAATSAMAAGALSMVAVTGEPTAAVGEPCVVGSGSAHGEPSLSATLDPETRHPPVPVTGTPAVMGTYAPVDYLPPSSAHERQGTNR